jgi:hypothetical protein
MFTSIRRWNIQTYIHTCIHEQIGSVLPNMFTSIRRGLDNTFKCDISKIEGLRALTRVLKVASLSRTTAHTEQALACAGEHTPGWLPLLCRCLVSSEHRVRDGAHECLSEARTLGVIDALDADAAADCIMSELFHNNMQSASPHKNDQNGAQQSDQDTMKVAILQRITDMVHACGHEKETQIAAQDGLRAWGAVCALAGKKMVKNGNINDFLKVMENAFSSRCMYMHVYICVYMCI